MVSPIQGPMLVEACTVAVWPFNWCCKEFGPRNAALTIRLGYLQGSVLVVSIALRVLWYGALGGGIVDRCPEDVSGAKLRAASLSVTVLGTVSLLVAI